MKRAVVTGGAGFIGSNLVRLLLDKQWEVCVIDDFSVGQRKNLPNGKKNLKIKKADIRDKDEMKKIIRDYDVVFHLAVQCLRKSFNDPWLVHSVNAGGTLSILEAARQNGISRFVYISSSEVYGTAQKIPMDENHPLVPTTVYGASKLAGELYSSAFLHTYHYPTVIVRPFNTYGYNEHLKGDYAEVIPRFVTRALNGLPLQIFGDGNQTRDLTFVEDTVEGIYSIAEKFWTTGGIYNVARGKEISILDLAKMILGLLKLKLPIEHLDPRPGDVRRHLADTERTEKEIGFKAKIGIEEGLLKYIKWFKKEIPDPKKALKYYETENW